MLIKMPPRYFVFLLSFFFVSHAYAKGSLQIGMGFYSLSAKVGDRSTALSGPGHFELVYNYPFTTKIEGYVGYSIVNESLLGGDRGFGPQIGIKFSYWGHAQNSEWKRPEFDLKIQRSFSPYFMIGFHQRQYQSTRSSYSGPGLGAGFVTDYYPKISFFAEFLTVLLNGGGGATATENSIIVGAYLRI